MDVTKIPFEKKEAITRILDAAVKAMDFEQKNYLTRKAQLIRIVENRGNEGLSLSEVVSESNQFVSMKDLVDRHLRDDRQPEKMSNKNKNFFAEKVSFPT